MLFSLMMDWLSNWKERMFIVKPHTVIKWHRKAFKFYWRWKSKPKGGRPKISREVIALIKQMANENPNWGAPRIHGEFVKLQLEMEFPKYKLCNNKYRRFLHERKKTLFSRTE